MPSNPVELCYCNCADCGRPCLGERTWAALQRRLKVGQAMPGRLHVAGRIKDRPYCNECLALIERSRQARRNRTEAGENREGEGWQENVIKLLEEGR